MLLMACTACAPHLQMLVFAAPLLMWSAGKHMQNRCKRRMCTAPGLVEHGVAVILHGVDQHSVGWAGAQNCSSPWHCHGDYTPTNLGCTRSGSTSLLRLLPQLQQGCMQPFRRPQALLLCVKLQLLVSPSPKGGNTVQFAQTHAVRSIDQPLTIRPGCSCSAVQPPQKAKHAI